jgi:hypothetical protein
MNVSYILSGFTVNCDQASFQMCTKLILLKLAKIPYMKTSTIFHDDFEKCSELWPASTDRNVALQACFFQNTGLLCSG